MKKYIVFIAASVLLLAAACVATKPEEALVIALSDQVQAEAFVINPNTGQANASEVTLASLPKEAQEILEAFFKTKPETIVVTQAQFLKAEVKPYQVVQLTPQMVGENGESSPGFLALLGQFLPAAGIAFPPAAPFIPLAGYLLALLGAKRSRQHLGNAVKSATPLDGTINLGAAIVSISKAIGLAHSTEDPDELAALAVRKKTIVLAKTETPRV